MKKEGLKKNKSLSFGTSSDNPYGLKLQLKYQEDTQISYGEVIIPSHFQGHKSEYVHPGILSVLLDEVMMNINDSMNLDTMVNDLNIRFLQPVRVNETLYFRAYFVKKNRSIIEHRAEIENDIGKILIRAKGKYIEINPLD